MKPTTQEKEATMTAHTPGPWSVRKIGQDLVIESTAGLAGRGIAGAEILAEVRNGPVQANARLMAAAPRMLHALKAFFTIQNSQDIEQWTAKTRALLRDVEGP